MSEFERVESIVRVVVGRPVSYLTLGIIVISRWLYQGAGRVVRKLRQRARAANSPVSR